jgi:hypothetical protein
MDGYPAGAICLSDCDTACAWSGSVGDLQAGTSLWLGTRVARVLEFARTDPGWRCHGSPYLDTDHRNCACTKRREARAGALGLDHRWTLSIYAESYVCRGTSIMAGVGAVLWKPGRFSGMYRTAASCESRNCASGRTEFGSSIRSGLSYVQEAGAPLVGTSQQPEIGAVMARSARA